MGHIEINKNNENEILRTGSQSNLNKEPMQDPNTILRSRSAGNLLSHIRENVQNVQNKGNEAGEQAPEEKVQVSNEEYYTSNVSKNITINTRQYRPSKIN